MYIINTSKKNDWYIDDNRLATSLMSFYVDIKLFANRENNHHILRVVDTNTEIKELSYEFTTLEDAIRFTENFVAKCRNFDEVIASFKEYSNEKKKVLKRF